MRFASSYDSQAATPLEQAGPRRILLVGNPNVGKSALFNRLTGTYVVVSNYPGTTVEVSRGKCRVGGEEYLVEDTPGMYSLLPITEEERVGRDLLFEGDVFGVLHVVDAKNLKRMLPLTLQLVEAGLPVVLVLNMMDEAERLGIRIDTATLEQRLGIPVVATSALSGGGIEAVKEQIRRFESRDSTLEIFYGEPLEAALNAIAPLMPPGNGFSQRFLAILAAQGDTAALGLLPESSAAVAERAFEQLNRTLAEPPTYAIPMRVHQEAERLCAAAFFPPSRAKETVARRLSEWTMNPITGFPLLLLVLYFGLYQFVGVFGAGVVVNFLEEAVFGTHVIPWVNRIVETYIPWHAVRELVGLEHGIVTLGLRYAVAIILPIVGTFFIAFSIIEDTGYLPRLAMLVDRIFKTIGLNGRAVIPMTLGFGCDTMATMVTRTLETKRERIIATLLLALAIPCSAQLGVILCFMAQAPAAMGVWAGFVILVFLLIGFLTAQLMPGDRPNFYMEVPPLRLPRPGAVLIKTYTRMQWYFAEILPLFILASVLIWAGKITGIFDWLVAGLAHVMGWIGLPKEAAVAFLFGFFRRDYGAAGLYDLQKSGALDGNQLAVAAITLTLFIPCIAQFLVMKKEQGLRIALAIGAFVFVFAFASGGFVNAALNLLGVRL